MQLELDAGSQRRNLGFTLVLMVHGLVGWMLIQSKIQLPTPAAVESTVLALISRAPATQMQAASGSTNGGSGSVGVSALAGKAVPDLAVAVDFVPVSIEEPAPAYSAQPQAEYRPATVAPVPAPLPVSTSRAEQVESQPAAVSGDNAVAAGGGIRTASGSKAGTDEIDYEALPAAMLAIDCQAPPYPRDAVEKAESGTVRLALLIDAQGRVVQSRVVRSSKSTVLDRASRDAIANCQFVPATRNGVSAQGWVILNYIWTLHQKPGVFR
jgi:TonB family protein